MVMGLDKRVVAVADIGGTAILALQGTATAMAAGLDLYGVLVIAFAASLGGGIIRDVLLGQTPPASFRYIRYALTVFVAAFVVILIRDGSILSSSLTVRLLGALGLGLFTVAGTEKALGFGCRSFAAVMIGTISATGGGMLRDVLLGRVPVVLRADFYATAALSGAVVIVLMRRAGVSGELAGLAGGLICIALRVAAIMLGWHLPSFT
jgi:uncharacterized membrane protein YeiH